MSSGRLAVLAHEVRSPVAALAAIAEAYPAADTATRQRLLELAEAAVAGLERLLAGALDEAPRLERLDVGRIARDAAETAALGGSPVVVDADDGLLADVDPDRLRQAVDNLIGNAIGHSRSGGTVTVTARRVGESVVLEVSDEGDGIPADDLGRVFEPGVRLTDSRPGSGLGLAIVRAIAREHGGEVEVESSPGQGATFRLVLPGASAEG